MPAVNSSESRLSYSVHVTDFCADHYNGAPLLRSSVGRQMSLTLGNNEWMPHNTEENNKIKIAIINNNYNNNNNNNNNNNI